MNALPSRLEDVTFRKEQKYLDLNIKHSIRADRKVKSLLNIGSKSLLVALLDRCPFLAEIGIFKVLEKTFKLRQVLEPNSLVDLQSLGDEVTELWVALIEPAARSN